MKKLLIINASVVNEGTQKEMDILIEDGRIAQIASDLKHISGAQLIDAAGKTLIPGMIDDQVHFREPGLTHKGDFATESRAAIAGGITSYMEMPNSKPLTTNHEALENKYQLAAEKSVANYAFYLGASNNNIEQIKSVDPKAACGIKVFMGASTGDMLVDDPKALEQIFEHAPILIATHCEDTPIIKANEEKFDQALNGQVGIEHHPQIRSAEACYASSSLAVGLAKKYNSKLHVLHLTTAKELALFTTGPVKDKRITVEACVHHLFFNEEDYALKGNQIKCNPAIKAKSDQLALQQAVKDGVIDVIATDHAPHTWEEKQRPYTSAPAGLPLVQHALLTLLEHYHSGLFDLELIVEKTAHAPAQLYNVVDRGYIREGYWADLVLVDLNKPTHVEREALLAKCAWSPFDGYTFKSSIDTTIVNGRIAYQNGTLNEPLTAMRLEFAR